MSLRSIYEDSHPLSPIKGRSIQVLPCFSNSKNSIRLTAGEITEDYPFVVGNVLADFFVSSLGQTVIPLKFSRNTTINFLLERIYRIANSQRMIFPFLILFVFFVIPILALVLQIFPIDGR
jgi:hypothetical protein